MRKYFFVIIISTLFILVLLVNSGFSFDQIRDVDESYFTDQNGRYLIICHDWFYEEILPLARWKHQKGMEVEIAKISEIGATANQIKTYITDAYENWDIPPEYVLLVGDSEYIMTGNGGTDNFYADMEGDFRAELLIGRLSCDSPPECEVQVNKTIGYQFPVMDLNPNWFRSATLIVRDDFDSSDSVYYADTQLAYDLMDSLGFTDIDTIFFKNNETASDIHEAVNDGRSLVNYRGVGSANWSFPFDCTPEVMTNDYMLPIIMSATCGTGLFAVDGYICERWVRAGTPDNPKGAVAFYGTYTSGYSFEFKRSAMDRGFIKSIYQNGNHVLGQACLDAKEFMIDNMPNEVDEYKAWNLLGDPELNIWTDVPSELTVAFPDTITDEPTEITFSVYEDGTPVENALVCAIKEQEVYGYEYTTSDGEATIAMDPVFPGFLYVTVTAPNHLVYQDSIWVDGILPSVCYESHTIDDSESGNGDGTMNPGETLDIYLTLKNLGQQTAENVSAILELDENEYINIEQNLSEFGDIAGGEISTNDLPFIVEISQDCPHDYLVDFAVIAFDDSDNYWESDVTPMFINGADVLMEETFIDDTSGGDGDGKIDPGEDIELTCSFHNAGDMDLSAVEIFISSDDPFITITQSDASFSQIISGEVVENTDEPFELSIEPDVNEGHQIPIEMSISGITETYEYQEVIQFDLVVFSRMLFVDDDYGMDNEEFYLEIFDELEISPQIWDITTQGNPDAAILSEYDAITWYTGFSTGITLDEENQNAIASYLDNGGNLFVVGNHIGGDIGDTEFYTDYLHTQDYGGSFYWANTVQGMDGDPVGDGFSAGITVDHALEILNPTSDASLFLEYEPGDDGAGIRYDGDYRLIYIGFVLENVSYWERRVELMRRILGYLGVPGMGHLYIDNISVADENENYIIEGDEPTDIILTLNSELVEAEELTGTLSTDDPDITILQGNADFGAIEFYDYTDNADSPFEILVDSDAEPHQVPFSVSMNSEDGSEETLNFELFVGTGDLVLVDDDAGKEYESYYLDALAELGAIVNYKPVQFWGSPSETLLSNYSTVIWFTGDESEETLTEPDRQVLANYMDNGGNLFVTGQDIGMDISETDFYADYLHAELTDENWTGTRLIKGVDGDPIGDDLVLLIAGGEGAGNQDSPSAVEPLGSAVQCMGYFPEWDGCGIRYDGDHKMVYFSFGYEAISTWENQIETMSRILEYFDMELAVDDEYLSVTPPNTELAQNYPNPFNPTTKIGYQLANSTDVTLKIYDITGRLIKVLVDETEEAGYHAVIWHGKDDSEKDVSSGMYMYRLQTKDSEQTKRMLLLR